MVIIKRNEMFEVSKCWKHAFVIFSANQGPGWSLSNRGDEVRMCRFKEIDFGLRNMICVAPKMDPKLN